MREVLAYFITFTCYGTWLHGDDRGSIDDEHNLPGTPVLLADPARRLSEEMALTCPPYRLDEQRRRIVLQVLLQLASKKSWLIHALHVRSNHIHLVVTAPGSPERVMNDCKTAISQRLNKEFPSERGQTRWTRHGSTRYLWNETQIAEKVQYVVHEQGTPMERFPDLGDANFPQPDPNRQPDLEE